MFRKFYPVQEEANGGEGGGGALTIAEVAKVINEALAPITARLDKLEGGGEAAEEMAKRKTATNHLGGRPGVQPRVTEAKDLTLDVKPGQEMDARMGWRIIERYLDRARVSGHEDKSWYAPMAKRVAAFNAAVKSGYLAAPVTKAGQNISSFSEGGIWAKETISGEMIPFLRESSIMLSLPGLTTMTDYGARFTMNRQVSAPSAQWAGEGASAASSKTTWDEVVLGAHKLIARTTISNDLIRLANGSAAAQAGEQLRLVMAEKVDLALVSGKGSGMPNGFLTLMDSSQSFAVTTPASTQATVNDLAKLRKTLRKAFVPDANTGVYLLSTSDFYSLMSLRTTEGYVFPELRNESPTINGRPVYESTRFEGIGSGTTGGVANNILAYVQPSHIVFGESQGMEIETGENGDDFIRDECTVRGIGYGDSGMKFRKAVAILNNTSY